MVSYVISIVLVYQVSSHNHALYGGEPHFYDFTILFYDNYICDITNYIIILLFFLLFKLKNHTYSYSSLSHYDISILALFKY